jgi:hypothetical protein
MAAHRQGVTVGQPVKVGRDYSRANSPSGICRPDTVMSGPSRGQQPLCQLGTFIAVADLKPGMSMGRVCRFRGTKSSFVNHARFDYS